MSNEATNQILKCFRYKLLILFLFAFPLSSSALDITLKAVKVRFALAENYPTSIYFSIENSSNQIDYLVDAKILDCPSCKVKINKTIFEKSIARIINLDRIALPSKSKVNSEDFRIYISVDGLKSKNFRMKLIFASGYSVVVTSSKH